MNYLQLLTMDTGLYKVDHLTLNTLVHLIKTCDSSGVTSDYVNKIDYITIYITTRVVYNTGEVIETKAGHTYYDTLDDYEYYINGINGYLCLYSINKIINLETMHVCYEVRDCVITNHSIQRDFTLNRILN